MLSSNRNIDSRRRSRSPDRPSRRDRDERDYEGARYPRRSLDRDGDRGGDRHKNHERSRSPRPNRSRRHRSHSRSPRRSSKSPDSRRDKDRRKRGRSRSHSRSRSVSSGHSDSDDRRRHKHKKDKHKKRSRSRERKDRKKEKKKRKNAASSSQWGKHGIISDSDFYTKAQEFRTWLLEERKINPESISKDQEKREFSKFVEDFNTATLPHEKYYHMEAYDRRMAALRQGEYLPPANDLYNPDMDLKAHSSKHKKTPVEQESYLSKEQLMELRKVQHERIEAGKMRILGMDIKTNYGVRMDGTGFD